MPILVNNINIPNESGNIVEKSSSTYVKIVTINKEKSVWKVETNHIHTDSCYKICGGRLITPYGTHYTHQCSVCGNISYNSYAADEEATPGDYCDDHGTCDQKILKCGYE